MSVWATYVKRGADQPWRLEAMSVLGAERSRSLAEREHARERVIGAEFQVREFASTREVPERLES
ncbi:MAG TPA: hypothetical protein VFX49_02355 [Chloroflexota bacterium]|nr:hypothetical protein [Chloroflexota bacterium]